MRYCHRAVAQFFAILMMFTDGREHAVPVMNQTFFISKNQCLIDYVGLENQFYVWISFSSGLKVKAIKKGEQEIRTMCSSCEKYAVICVE